MNPRIKKKLLPTLNKNYNINLPIQYFLTKSINFTLKIQKIILLQIK